MNNEHKQDPRTILLGKAKTIDTLFDNIRSLSLAEEFNLNELMDSYHGLLDNGQYSVYFASMLDSYRRLSEVVSSMTDKFGKIQGEIRANRDLILLEITVDLLYQEPDIKSFDIRNVYRNGSERGERIKMGRKLHAIIKKGIETGKYDLEIIKRYGSPVLYRKKQQQETPIDTNRILQTSPGNICSERRLTPEEICQISEQDLSPDNPYIVMDNVMQKIDKGATREDVEIALSQRYQRITPRNGNPNLVFYRTGTR